MSPDDIPVEAWMCLGGMGVDFLIKLSNRILDSESMPDDWMKAC